MAKVLSKGTTITMECDGDTAPVDIGCITSFDTPAASRDEIDVTCLASDAKEFALDLVDNGTATFDLIFDDCDDGQEALTDQLDEDEACEFVITLFGGTTITFDALVQSFQLSGSVGSAVTGSVTLRVTGAVEFDFACNA